MKQYLFNIYQPDSPQMPPPEILSKIMQDVTTLRNAMQARRSRS